ncbi:metallophosphoesterase [Chitinophaga niabensis]|uniref:Calcineurin-like phosphoesterase n=1 Tax=Chitinophaga niabensis TaxID=536979 RepID=A0A1N6JBZ4_9BACT|nr:metallophosphoesterase [Chitinophaga niabensis]SIO41731.1 Calcineurin-like phosphoesterase [Chitinophaga niabensis]
MLFPLISCLLLFGTVSNENLEKKRAILEVSFPNEMKVPLQELKWVQADRSGLVQRADWNASTPVRNGQTLKWKVNTSAPILFQTLFFDKTIVGSLIEPGDSIRITMEGDNISYSGVGSEKIIIYQEVFGDWAKLQKPANTSPFSTNSLDDYLEWDRYLETKRTITNDILKKYESKLSLYSTRYMKSFFYSIMEKDRLVKFMALWYKRKALNINAQKFNEIYDSTIRRPEALWLGSETAIASSAHPLYLFAEAEIVRDHNFEFSPGGSDRDAKFEFWKMKYNKMKELYTGERLDAALRYLFTSVGIRRLAMYPPFEKAVNEYYQSSAKSMFKEEVKKYQDRELGLLKGTENAIPLLSLLRNNNGSFWVNPTKNRSIVLYFNQQNCRDCPGVTSMIENILGKFKYDTSLLVLDIARVKDEQEWAKALKEGRKSVKGAEQLFVLEEDLKTGADESYGLSDSYSLIVVDQRGRIVRLTAADPLDDGEGSLTDFIDHQLALTKDGPYVLHKGDSLISYSLNKSAKQELSWGKNTHEQALLSGTDKFLENFDIKLKRELKVEPSIFSRPNKLMVLSDIEGNFNALRKLLEAGKIIDKQFNWIFGDGHLVFCGDMFDRGSQVTECLWLLYILEEKAKSQGGYVHFVLGNHEILNLSGDLRYLVPKYLENAELMGVPYSVLYNEQSELGRWIRTKNVIEKIGDLLFVHGGISSEVVDLNLPVTEINDISRKFYSRQYEAMRDSGKVQSILFNGTYSPFWFRGYYQKDQKQDLEPLVDKALGKFDVSHIITGHTIVADTISTLFNGKVINTDTKHSRGNSEMLYIVDQDFYRINSKGERHLLFTNRKE